MLIWSINYQLLHHLMNSTDSRNTNLQFILEDFLSYWMNKQSISENVFVTGWLQTDGEFSAFHKSLPSDSG